MDINIIHQLLVTIGVMLATQGVKKISLIPINDGQTARIRTFVGILTFAATGLTAYADGNLQGFLTPELLQVGLATVLSFVLAHLGYQNIIKPLDK